VAEIQDVLDRLDDLSDQIDNKIDAVEAKVDADKLQYEICNHCGGDGIKLIGDGTDSCPDCGGTGWFRKIGKISKAS